jgi:hypothetical protein
MGHDRGMTVRFTQSETTPLADSVAVEDILSEIADQLGTRVIEGPAELT